MPNLLPHDWARFRWNSLYQRLPAHLFRPQTPTPVNAPKIVVLNELLAQEMGLDITMLASEKGAALFAGNLAVDGLRPIAQAYAGHQFGQFTILGDGRAILWGEHQLPSKHLVDVQWKGAGPTPFSRGGDGRLALGPALREFLISEAIAALGIATTRSLAVVSTGETVFREQILPGAVLTRIASSHVRIGTFQFASVIREEPALHELIEYCIARHYPELGPAGPSLSSKRAGLFFSNVIDRQAELVAKWLSVGFIHGVMNTDNTTISGETIDFGPCAFLDEYNPDTVYSSIDRTGRYAFGKQPEIAAWNLARLGDTLIPFFGSTLEEGTEVANIHLETFGEQFNGHSTRIFGAKLGIAKPNSKDLGLVQELLGIAAREHFDFHQLWLDLTELGPEPTKLAPALTDWAKAWSARLASEGSSLAEATRRMRQANPIIIPRNHRVEHALNQASGGDLSSFQRLLAAVRTPFADSPEARELGAPPTEPNLNYRTFCGT